MSVLHGPDDVLGSPRRVSAEENARPRRLHRFFVDYRHVPLVEVNTQPALDPRESVFLADSEDHVVGRQENGIYHPRVPGSRVPLQPLEFHSLQFSALDHEALGRVIDHNLDAFLFGVFEFPRRGFEVSARPARHHLDVLSAKPARGAAAIHGGIADPDDQHPLSNGLHVAERDRFQPVDTDMNAIGFVSSGNLQVLAPRRAAAHEDRVKSLFEQRFHARDRRVVTDVDTHVENDVDLFIEHACRQPERRNVGSHQPAGLIELLEHHDLVAQGHQVVCHRKRCRTRPDARDALPVLFRGDLRKPLSNVPTVIRGNSLEPANGHRLAVQAFPAAGRLARPVARTS